MFQNIIPIPEISASYDKWNKPGTEKNGMISLKCGTGKLKQLNFKVEWWLAEYGVDWITMSDSLGSLLFAMMKSLTRSRKGRKGWLQLTALGIVHGGIEFLVARAVGNGAHLIHNQKGDQFIFHHALFLHVHQGVLYWKHPRHPTSVKAST